MRHARHRITTLAFLGAAALGAGAAMAAEPLRLAGSTCETPPVLHCPDAGCAGEVVTNGGPVIEPKTGRNYFLDYPCDLKPGEKVTFILSLHGGGSYGNWQRHYFPILDYKDKHRLVIATPYSPRRVWSAEDDEYLHNIVNGVVEEIGKENIKAFWLAGHSQGGMTSRRVVCTDFFKDKVDGFLSLSGGRIGGSPGRGESFGIPRQRTATTTDGAAPATGAPATPGPGGPPGGPRPPMEPPTCDFSHIYTTGEHEIGALPETSEWADKYTCEARKQRADVVDTKPGYVYDSTRQDPGTKGWGLLPRPGTAEVFVYPSCKSGRVVADVVRIDKGHTEGLEPEVTEELVKLMLSAHGGKLREGG
jgi:hypothetical protein